METYSRQLHPMGIHFSDEQASASTKDNSQNQMERENKADLLVNPVNLTRVRITMGTNLGQIHRGVSRLSYLKWS